MIKTPPMMAGFFLICKHVVKTFPHSKIIDPGITFDKNTPLLIMKTR